MSTNYKALLSIDKLITRFITSIKVCTYIQQVLELCIVWDQTKLLCQKPQTLKNQNLLMNNRMFIASWVLNMNSAAIFNNTTFSWSQTSHYSRNPCTYIRKPQQYVYVCSSKWLFCYVRVAFQCICTMQCTATTNIEPSLVSRIIHRGHKNFRHDTCQQPVVRPP